MRETRMIVPVLSRQVHRNRIDILRAVEVRVRRAGHRVAVAVRTIPRDLSLTGRSRTKIQGPAGPWTQVG